MCSVLISAARILRLSSLPHHPDKCLVSYAFLLTLIFVGLLALILAYVLFADYRSPVLIASLSSSGRDPRTPLNPLHVLLSWREPVEFFLPLLHSKSIEFGMLGLRFVYGLFL